MNIKLFGKSVFELNKGRDLFISSADEQLKKSAYLPDFSNTHRYNEFIDVIELPSPGISKGKKLEAIKDKSKTTIKLTPKAIYEMKMLNEKKFKVITDPEYIDEQLEQFKEKLDIVKLTKSDMSRGVEEISSILIRLENRKKYKKFKDFYDNYAYTKTTKIDELISKHSYLKLGAVAQFVADMPKEAIAEMKEYTNQTKKLCDKKPIFYIIAEKKDFEKTSGRKDPILLAQSPFGHFWQILGAWDKEMLLLEEL